MPRLLMPRLQMPRLQIVSVLIIAAALSSTAGADDTPTPSTVGAVEVISDSPDQQAHELAVLGLAPGTALHRRRLREGTQALLAGGDVEHLRIETRQEADGLHVTVHLWHRVRLTKVNVNGLGLRLRWRVHDWLELRTGAPVAVTAIERGVRRVERELRNRGWADVMVEPQLDYHRPDNTVSLVLRVNLGEPRLRGSVQVAGISPGEEPLAELSDLDEEKRLTDRYLERLRRRVVRELRGRGFWDAEVLGIERRVAQESSALGEEREDLLITVDTGPRYSLHATGPPGAEQLVRNAMPNVKEEEIHPAQTEALAERLREALQRTGRLLALVTVQVQTTPGSSERTLLVDLAPDRERTISEVNFSGAESLDQDTLVSTVRVRSGRVGGWRGQEVTDATLEVDRQSLVDLYLSRGYSDVYIAPALIEPDGNQAVRISFAIDEGRRHTLVEVRFEGFPVEAAAELEREQQSLLVGGAWDERLVEPERRRLEVALAGGGYPEGRVTAEIGRDPQGDARVALRAEPGPYVRIAEVILAGLLTVRESVVQRTLKDAGVVTGAPFSLQAMQEAQRGLYQLGLFRQVTLDPVPGHERRSERSLVVRCQEGKHRSYLLGAGFDTSDKLRLTLGWSHLNLLGRAHAFSAEARVSARDQRFQLSLRQQRLPWLEEPGALVAYSTEEEFASYSQRRRGLWLEIGDRRHTPFRRWLRYEYQLVRPEAPPEVLSELERREQETRISSISPWLEWDTRDDPLRPSQGILASLSGEYAFPLLRADASFLKMQGSLSHYGSLLGGTTALGVRAGTIHPVDSTSDEPANLQVPLNVRFFAGGRASHRAFRTDRLGIPGQTIDAEGNAIGGNALLLLKAEWERPIRGPLAGVVFVDAGNVWAEPASFSWGDLRWGAGLGVRVETPAGPLRLEYGYKLDRQPGESTGKLYLSFGVPF